MTDLAAIRDELRTLLEKATPGPWHAKDRGVGWSVHTAPEPADGQHWGALGGPECSDLMDFDTLGKGVFTEANARFLVAAVNALPLLLADTPSVEPAASGPWTRADGSQWFCKHPAGSREWFDDRPDVGWVREWRTSGQSRCGECGVVFPSRPSVEPRGETTEHEHSEWECGVMVHVGSRHWMDDPCTLTDEDRCRFVPYRNTRLDLRTEKP